MTPLEIFAVLMSVMGVALTIQRNILCWGFNIVACALYASLPEPTFKSIISSSLDI